MKTKRNKVGVGLEFFLLYFILIANCSWALQQLYNTTFSSNTSNWTINNGVSYNNLNTFGRNNGDGNPAACFYGYGQARKWQSNYVRDGYIEQNFSTPVAPVNVTLNIDHKEYWLSAYDNFNLTCSVRDGSGDIAPLFLIAETNGAAMNNTWQSVTGAGPVLLTQTGTTLTFRIYWYAKLDYSWSAGYEEAGAYVDNIELHMSPSGVTVSENGANIDVTWNASTGAVALHPTSPYRIYRSLSSGGPWTHIGTTNTTSFTDTSPPAAEAIYYTVADVDAAGNISPYAPEAVFFKFTIKDGLGPDIAYTFFEDRMEFNWKHPKASIMNYEVCVGTTPGASDIVSWTDIGLADHAVFTGLSLASGTTYYNSVKVIDTNGIVQNTGTSNGVMHRRDQVLTDTASQTFFHNGRVLDQIDVVTDPGSIRPKTFGGTGGAGYWRYSVPITVTEPNVTSRINAPCRVTFTIPGGQMNNVREIRVADDKGNELPRYNLNTSTTNLDFVFLVNMAQGETRTFWVYWGNNGVSDPTYGFQMNSDDISMNEWTPYYTRKSLPGGAEDVPRANMIHSGNSTDDGWSNRIDFPFDFYFYGNNERNNWYMNINGVLSHTATNDYSNSWNEFVGTRFNKAISPIWIDTMIRSLDDAGIYRDDMANPARVVFSWNCNRYNATDDIYYHQAVVYSTGDIALRYRYLSPRGLIGPGTTDRPVNIAPHHTVGLSNSDNNRWMIHTPLKIGIANTPTAFYQCMDAFRGNYTVGTISGGGGQQTVAHFESMIFDSRTSKPDWQTLFYEANGGAGRLRYSVRTGATPLPDLGGWSGWTVISTDTGNGSAAIPSPDERYLQYKVEFQRSNNGALPVLEEVRLVYGGISIDDITAANPSGVSQGQTGIPVQATVRNFYSAPVNLTDIDLTFDLGSYTTTLAGPALPAAIPADSTITVNFLVDVWDDSPVGTATIHAVATATAGALTFFDEDAQYPYTWWVRKKAELTLRQVEAAPTHVNKGQNGIPISLTIENTGETPFSLDVASLTFSLGDYVQTLLSPAYWYNC